MKRRIAGLSLSIASILVLGTAGLATASPSPNAEPALMLPPTMTGSFSASEVLTGQTVSAKFTIANPNAVALSAVGVTVFFNVAIPVFRSRFVCGGTLTHVGGNMAMLADATIAASSSCSFAIDVVGSSPMLLQYDPESLKANGVLAPSSGSMGSTLVVDQPTIQASFSPTSVVAGAKSTLKVTLANPATNSTAVGQAGATITLPSGLTVANGTSSAGTCGGTLTTVAPSQINISGVTIPAGGSCASSVSVTSKTSGVKSTTAKVHMDFGAGTNAVTAKLTVVNPAPVPTATPTPGPTESPTPAPTDTPTATTGESVAPSASPTAALVAVVSPIASASPVLVAAPTTPSGGGTDGAVLLLLGVLIGAVLALGSATVAVLVVRRRPVSVPAPAAPAAGLGTPSETEPPAAN